MPAHRRPIECNDRHAAGLPIDDRRRGKTKDARKRRRRVEVPQFIHCASLAQSLESVLVRAICPFVNAEIVHHSSPIRDL